SPGGYALPTLYLSQDTLKASHSIRVIQDLGEFPYVTLKIFQVNRISIQGQELLDVVAIPVSPGQSLINQEILWGSNQNLHPGKIDLDSPSQSFFLERRPGKADLHRNSCRLMAE